MKHLAIVIGLAALFQTPPPGTAAPTIPFDSSIDFLKYSPDMNLGEVLAVAVNSKGHIVVLNHPGSATSGPLYGNASTQLLEFDQTGKFVREIGKGVYGLGYSHSVRFDRYDNLWVVDKGTNAVVKFNPAGYVTMNLGRRPEGPDDPAESYYRGGRGQAAAVHVDGSFRQPTDIAWDSDDNIYVSDGYTNSRVAKFDKRGAWIKSWGSRGSGGQHADENPGQFNTPHNIGVDRQNNVYVADRGNRRIQVFDTDGRFLRMIHLNVPYDKKRHPVLGNLAANPPDETAPWTICITNGATQFLYTTDQEPGRLYKLTLEGRIVGMLGESGRDAKQFNWVHGIACPSDDVLYLADMNNWRVQKITLHPERMTKTATGSR
ncbi:MAG: 6-bladed beta-propeller [Acidobacteria bacterium]|nr:MAG: 6-bladed beta-propeller [Acidobacteriota bacterium]PYQ91280.1 MAG: 6-bladed beta-propeller [Acidobacteriota bacterium]PYR05196.1 MAG: 6-bladed beta-propeller [Acidobacteriota bacterium]